MRKMIFGSAKWLFTLLVLVLAATAVSAAQQPKTQSPENGKEKADPSKPIRVTDQPFKIEPTDQYVIGPDDVLAINVWREPEISRTLPVRPDGSISLPLVGEIKASGQTPRELQAKITEELRAYLSNPQVTVIVQDVRSQRFNIVGEVVRPGSYTLARPMTVLDAIATAGGFAQWAKTSKIYVLRRNKDGSRLIVPFNYKDVIKGKKFYQDLELEPGDTIVVP